MRPFVPFSRLPADAKDAVFRFMFDAVGLTWPTWHNGLVCMSPRTHNHDPLTDVTNVLAGVRYG